MFVSRFTYVTYISATPEKLFRALTDPKATRKYWQHENVSDWKVGSRWEHRSTGRDHTVDLVGRVIEYSPPRRLVLSWAFPEDEMRVDKHSKVTLEIGDYREVVRLTLTHEGLDAGSAMYMGITEGWPIVLSSLKSLMETGRALPEFWLSAA